MNLGNNKFDTISRTSIEWMASYDSNFNHVYMRRGRQTCGVAGFFREEKNEALINTVRST